MFNVANLVVSGQAGFALETLIADMAACCLDRLLFKISIHALPFRTVQLLSPTKLTKQWPPTLFVEQWTAVAMLGLQAASSRVPSRKRGSSTH